MNPIKKDAESRYRELSRKVDQLENHIRQGGADMEERFKALMEDVRAKREEVEDRMREYREAGDTKPINIKQNLDQAVVALRQAYDRVNQTIKQAA